VSGNEVEAKSGDNGQVQLSNSARISRKVHEGFSLRVMQAKGDGEVCWLLGRPCQNY
jgi:hypothetical protein